jgi:hypothetical protein
MGSVKRPLLGLGLAASLRTGVASGAVGVPGLRLRRTRRCDGTASHAHDRCSPSGSEGSQASASWR